MIIFLKYGFHFLVFLTCFVDLVLLFIISVVRLNFFNRETYLDGNTDPLLYPAPEMRRSEPGPLVEGEGAFQGFDDPQLVRQPTHSATHRTRVPVKINITKPNV